MSGPVCRPGISRQCGKACIPVYRNCRIDGTPGSGGQHSYSRPQPTYSMPQQYTHSHPMPPMNGYYRKKPVCKTGKECGNACIPMANNCTKTNPLGAPNKRTTKPECKSPNIPCGYSCIPPYKTCHKDDPMSM